MTDHSSRVLRQPGTSTTTEHGHSYLPGMGVDWLLPLYDPLTRALGIPSAHGRLAEQAELRPGHRVLEIGCGTGNLALVVNREYPGTHVVGLDPDPKALARARRKAAREGLSVQLDRGFAGELPYPDESFDRVLSAFMFHHLDPTEKRKALREAKRILRPGGSLHLLDFGGARERSDGLVARLSHRSKHLQDNLGERIPTLMREEGLADPVEISHRVTLIGRYTFYRAARVGPGNAPC